MATSKQPTNDDKSKVGTITPEELSLRNQLRLKRELKKAAKEELDFRKQVASLERDQIRNAKKYEDTTKEINRLNELMVSAKARGNKNTIKYLDQELKKQKQQEESLRKTTGGALRMRELEARKTKEALNAERQLIKDINKERGLGAKFADMFRSKESRQRQIDIARARAGGGANIPPGGGGTGGGAGTAGGGAGGDGKGGGAVKALLGATVIGGLILAIGAGLAKLKAMFGGVASGIGGALQKGVSAPLQDAAKILGSKDAVGIGGGAVSGAGATSILDGLGDMLGTIPFIGGALKGLVGMFKGVLDAVLGINQANVNVARNMGISLKEASALRDQMRGIADASHNIVVNSTRLLESQLEIGGALGVNNVMTASILENNVKLKDIAGLELGARKAIAEISIATGKDADKVTKTMLGQIGYLKSTTGISFKYQQIMSEIGKLSGVLGLNFLKNDKKMGETLLKVKSLGFDLKQVNDIASSFLDFESSISKEFEAQVLTGKEMNLTKAREAALNNDLATLTSEITKNVGNSTAYLKLNRIQQDAVAESVGMTRDSLADAMKQQELLNALGAKDLKQAQQQFEIYKKQGLTKDQIIEKIGAENYENINQVSIAEKLAAVMEKIKQTFIDFVEKSKIFEFLTDEKRVNGFIRSIISGLAGAIDTVGDILASLIGAIGSLPFTDKAKWQGYADIIRSGASSFSGGVRSISGGVGLAEGGVVTETGMAKVDKGEVYLGASSISVLKDQLDAQKETNKLLAALVNQRQSIRIDGREVAIANAENAGTIYQGQTS